MEKFNWKLFLGEVTIRYGFLLLASFLFLLFYGIAITSHSWAWMVVIGLYFSLSERISSWAFKTICSTLEEKDDKVE